VLHQDGVRCASVSNRSINARSTGLSKNARQL
jgi:hypothetical protein